MERLQGRNDPEYIAYLELRIAELERRVPKTRLISPHFLTRAVAVYGYYLIGSAVVAIIGLLAFALIAGIGSLLQH